MELERIINTDNSGVRSQLLRAIELIGMKAEKITRQEVDVIVDYLSINFSLFPVGEIQNAFEAGIKGDLDIDMTHYQSFNSLYVSNVLTSYKRYRAKRNREPKLIEPAKQIGMKKETREEQAEFNYKLLVDSYEKIGKEPYAPINWNAAYWYLEQNNIIDMLDNDAKEMFKENVVYDIKKEISELKAHKRQYSHLIEILESSKRLKTECRKRLTIKHFNNKYK